MNRRAGGSRISAENATRLDAVMAELKRIVCVVRVEESGPPPRVMVDRTFAVAGAEAEPATPIEPGTVELRAAVARTVEVAP